MIDKDMKDRLRDAFNCSFMECSEQAQYMAVMSCMVEVFTALNLTADDISYISSTADGNCKEVDDIIDELVAIFEDE